MVAIASPTDHVSIPDVDDDIDLDSDYDWPEHNERNENLNYGTD